MERREVDHFLTDLLQEESTAVEEPPAPASASDSKILSPWQAELIAKKKQPKLAPKPAAGKPKPSPGKTPWQLAIVAARQCL